jgi:hypothetical protein
MKVIMRFEVPQFINIEDKLFGPFTFKQSLYLVGGGGIVFVIHKLLPSFVTVLVGLPIAAFSLALVFYKPNGRPFMKMVEAFVLYTFSEKFYLWRRKDQKPGAERITQVHKKFPEEGALPEENNRKKISDLAWSLDILDFEE